MKVLDWKGGIYLFPPSFDHLGFFAGGKIYDILELSRNPMLIFGIAGFLQIAGPLRIGKINLNLKPK